MARIVIVDDSSTIIKIMSTALTARGHQVVATGSDGNQAVQLFAQHKPDLLILDVTMPNKSGREALQEITKAHPGSKVIMLSSVGLDTVIKECLGLGAKAFIQKEKLANRQAVEDEIERVLKG